MFKRITLAAAIAAFSVVLFTAQPAKAIYCPWCWAGALGINFAIAEGQLAVCFGKPDLSPTGLFHAVLPVIGPWEAYKACQQQRTVAKR